MQPDTTTAHGDKQRAVLHYTALAAEAARIQRLDLSTLAPTDDAEPLPVPEVTDSSFGDFMDAVESAA